MDKERSQERLPEPENPFKNVISTILLDENQVFNNSGEITTVVALYKVACNPEGTQVKYLNKQLEKLKNESLVSFARGLQTSPRSQRREFIKGLSQVIEDTTVPDLHLNAKAIHVGYNIGAWELEKSLSFLKVLMSQVHEQDMYEWASVIKESDEFMDRKRQAHRVLDETEIDFVRRVTLHAENKNTYPELDIYRDFIKSLDLDDFEGGKEII